MRQASVSEPVGANGSYDPGRRVDLVATATPAQRLPGAATTSLTVETTQGRTAGLNVAVCQHEALLGAGGTKPADGKMGLNDMVKSIKCRKTTTHFGFCPRLLNLQTWVTQLWKMERKLRCNR